MGSPKQKITLVVALLILSVLACSYYGSPAPVGIPTSTPDLTRTAIIDILQTSQPTPTEMLPTLTVEGQGASIQSGAEVASPTPETPTPTQTPIPTDTPLPTDTPVPTITLTPTVSYAGPGMRAGTSIAAVHMSSPPNINGDLSDWSLGIYPAGTAVYGADKISDEADLTANVMVGWDTTYMYVGARVKDEFYQQNETGKNLFKGDSVEILLDTNVGGDFYLNTLSYDDYQLGVSPGFTSKGNNPEAYLWFPTNVEGSRSQVQIGILPTANGYHIELAIPWSVFGVNPYKGQHFGFAFSVSDNDLGGQSVQQSMISNVSTRKLTLPMTWGDLTLTD
ncbi:MAG: hypothetical protein ISR58_01950 [Anaerolineales bacterium]|nr:hypothetical protein [Chloroflexota bacterium]MBL6979930.1 hypothetical protein [Anaerolineales bacterium]